MGSLFPGMQAMHDVHPLFVHFPIACFAVAFLFQSAVVAARRPQWQKWPSKLLWHHAGGPAGPSTTRGRGGWPRSEP
jgi:hypothetical protein